MTFTMALMTVIMRRHRDVPMLEAAALSGFAAAIIAFTMTDPFTATDDQHPVARACSAS